MIKKRGPTAQVVVMRWPCPRHIHPLLLDMAFGAAAANTLEGGMMRQRRDFASESESPWAVNGSVVR